MLPNIFAHNHKPRQYDQRNLPHVNKPVIGEDGRPLDLAFESPHDTEFVQYKIHPFQLRQRKYLSAQIRHLELKGKNEYYNHQSSDYPIDGYPTFSDVLFVDFLRDAGYDISIRRSSTIGDLPTFSLRLEAHFALAEMGGVWTGEYLNDIIKLLTEFDPKKPRIFFEKRLQASTPVGRYCQPYVDLPWIVTLYGVDYQVRLEILDTVAINGQASYADLCKGNGITLTYKDAFTTDEKGRMDEMQRDRPEDFVNYSTDDLQVLLIWHRYCDSEKTKFLEMGVEGDYNEPKLTIGANVMELFRARAKKVLDFNNPDNPLLEGVKDVDKVWDLFTKKFIAGTSASSLRLNPARTSSLNSKVFGGRASNNMSNIILVSGMIANLDVDGAYANIQRLLSYPFGNPEIWDYKADEAEKSAISLEDWLKEYGTSLDKIRKGDWGDLVPHLFQVVVTTFKDELSFHQDYLPSWFLNNGEEGIDICAKYFSKVTKSGEDFDDGFTFESTDLNEEDGSTKVIGRQIVNGIVTAPFLVHLAHHYNKSSSVQKAQVNELLTKLKVLTSIVYPKSTECKDLNDFLSQEKAWKEKTTNKRISSKGRKFIRTDDGKFHGWFAVGLAELIIDILLINRKKYPKKSPMNNLYKLNCNTTYGDMTAKDLIEANVVVGNNITALVRHLCYLMEKGLFGFQSITDGCAIDANNVPYPRRKGRKLTPTQLTHLSMNSLTELNSAEIELRPLANFDNFSIDRVDTLIDSNGKEFKQPWVVGVKGNKRHYFPVMMSNTDMKVIKPMMTGKLTAQEFFAIAAKRHMQKLFPNDPYMTMATSAIKVKPVGDDWEVTYQPINGAFTLETKMVHEKAVSRGTADYLYSDSYNDKDTKAMRSYRDELHEVASIDGMDEGRKINPSLEFLTALKNPTRVARQLPFLKRTIIKSGEYKQRADFFRHLGLYPGDSYLTVGMLREFSMSQFSSHFNTVKQYLSWIKDVSKDKELYGQSLERYFTNPDGTIDVATMSQVVCEIIHSGVMHYRQWFHDNNWFERKGKKYDSNALEHPYYKDFKQMKAWSCMTVEEYEASRKAYDEASLNSGK